jgi:hypothetical protein
MNYKLKIEGHEGQNVEAVIGFWKGPKLMVNGAPAPKGEKRGDMILQRNDGKKVTARWKSRFLGLDVPNLVLDGREITLVESLKWVELIWCALPLFLLFVGGALGGLVGFVGFTFNARIFRINLNTLSKYLISGMVSVFAVTIHVVFALFIQAILQPLAP